MPPTPKPKVQAPKKRGSAPNERRNRQTLYLLAAAGIVGVVVVLGVVLLTGGGSSSGTTSSAGAQALKDAGCTVQSVASLPSGDHSVLTPAGTSPKWDTDPPTSGPHYQTPVIWGAYTDPVNLGQLVHNLEHGGIYILYGPDVPEATVAELTAFYGDRTEGTVLAPLPKLGNKIALGAWTTKSPQTPNDGTAYLAKCTTFDKSAFAAFFDDYQFQGPERFPSSSLLPGS